MQDSHSIAKINGLTIGSLLSVEFLLQAQFSIIFSYISYFIFALIIVMVYGYIIKFQENNCEGKIEFKQTFRLVFQIYFYGSIISSFVIYIYCQFFDKDLMGILITNTYELYKNKMPFMINENTLPTLQLMYKPAPFAISNIFSGALTGSFWGLIFGAYFKNKKHTPTNNQ